jgi:hypothetical protein
LPLEKPMKSHDLVVWSFKMWFGMTETTPSMSAETFDPIQHRSNEANKTLNPGTIRSTAHLIIFQLLHLITLPQIHWNSFHSYILETFWLIHNCSQRIFQRLIMLFEIKCIHMVPWEEHRSIKETWVVLISTTKPYILLKSVTIFFLVL